MIRPSNSLFLFFKCSLHTSFASHKNSQTLKPQTSSTMRKVTCASQTLSIQLKTPCTQPQMNLFPIPLYFHLPKQLHIQIKSLSTNFNSQPPINLDFSINFVLIPQGKIKIKKYIFSFWFLWLPKRATIKLHLKHFYI